MGLAVCYTANVWNIGAEGQFTFGALLGGLVPVYFTAWQSPLTLVAMLALGVVGGMMFAAIPAWLKNRFSANEILTSLMLVYVAQLFLDWLVRGPWRDPHGFNFPKSVTFEGWQLLPTIGATIHIGAVLRRHRRPGAGRAHGAHAQGLRSPGSRQRAAGRPFRRLFAQPAW